MRDSRRRLIVGHVQVRALHQEHLQLDQRGHVVARRRHLLAAAQPNQAVMAAAPAGQTRKRRAAPAEPDEEEEDEHLIWSAEHHHAISMPSLVATTTVDRNGAAGAEVKTSVLRSRSPPPPPNPFFGTAVRHQPMPVGTDLISGLKLRSPRPASPDVTRAAMQLEREKQLGAIPKATSALAQQPNLPPDTPSPTSR